MFVQPTIYINMALTDKYIFQVISSALKHGEGQLSYDKIADIAGCHPNTVRNSTRRLATAGKIEMSGGKGRKVHYKVISDETHMG